MLIVPTDAPGLEIRKLGKLGGRCLSTCEVFFSDVEVPLENLVGERDAAWSQLVKTLNHERITVAANAIGNAQAALDDAIQFAKDVHRWRRDRFGAGVIKCIDVVGGVPAGGVGCAGLGGWRVRGTPAQGKRDCDRSGGANQTR